MEIVSYDNCSNLNELREPWDRLADYGLFFIPSFSELQNQLEFGGNKFRLLVARENSQTVAAACFIYGSEKKTYRIGKRKLFHLPVQAVTLFGSCVVGEADESVIRQLFHLIIKEGDFDIINIGHIFIASPLYKAITNLHGVRAWRTARKTRLWWLIRLPRSFDEYLASLPEKTRRHIARDCRKFERQAPHFRIMRSPEEVDVFLRDAERISLATYQWDLTYGLRNDESTRQQFIRLARSGALRCYITYLQGEPCAFGWGELGHRRFSFRQTGYDPRYRRLSPGTALIAKMIRDLIESSCCDVFDFQWGSENGYKSRFGNVGLGCTSMQVANIYAPYSLLIVMLDHLVNSAKNLVGIVVERGPLKERLRAALRQHGIGTF